MLPQREIGDRAGESPSLVVTITTGLELFTGVATV